MNGNIPNHSGSALAPIVSESEQARQARQRLVIASLITLALWFVPFSDLLLYPLRLFVTFVHESGHAIASLITGGQVASLSVHADGSGVTMSRVAPWWSWLTISGGYLGTTIFGAVLLHVGRMNRWRNAGRTALVASAFFVLGMTVLFGRDLFTWGAGAVVALLLYVLATKLKPDAANFVASFLAVQCCLNAIGDIRILLHLTTMGSQENDAGFMAKAVPILPATGWATLWAVMAGLILLASLRNYWRATAQRGS